MRMKRMLLQAKPKKRFAVVNWRKDWGGHSRPILTQDYVKPGGHAA